MDPTFGNSDGESQVPVANVNIARWLSAALTSLWMNQQHVEGLLLSTLTSISGTRLKGKPLTISELAEGNRSGH